MNREHAATKDSKGTPVRLLLEHCEIRSWDRRDIPALVRNANSYNVWRNLRDRFPFPYTTVHGEAWVRAATQERPQTSFAVVAAGEAAGGIGFLPQEDVGRHSAEIGYWLGETHWGQGLMTEALRGFVPWVFDHFAVCRLYAYVFEWNPASCRVLEKCGFELEGRLRKSVAKDGQIIDQFLYSLVREPPLPGERRA